VPSYEHSSTNFKFQNPLTPIDPKRHNTVRHRQTDEGIMSIDDHTLCNCKIDDEKLRQLE